MKIDNILVEHNIDAILIFNMNNVFYLSKFDGSTATLLFTKNDKYIFVDSRYYEQAIKQTETFNVVLVEKNNLYELIKQIVIDEKINLIGFENDINYSTYLSISEKCTINNKSISLKNLREIKDDDELSIIQKACKISDQAFMHILDFVKVGVSENDINIEIQKFILDYGASGLAFNTIVASGKRSSLPHGVASDKIIEDGDFITIDFGIKYKGYCSDITRTIAIGSKLNQELIKIYDIVKKAQQKAIDAIKPGVKASEIDYIARDYINKAGYKDYFNHGLGHGFGLEVHEEPYINSTSIATLKENHIITIEPGIYIPNLGGVRIEDDILVTKNGCISLSNAPKDLIILKGNK